MMEQCVTHVDSNQYLVLDGSVQNVVITTCVPYAIIVKNINYVTDFIE